MVKKDQKINPPKRKNKHKFSLVNRLQNIITLSHFLDPLEFLVLVIELNITKLAACHSQTDLAISFRQLKKNHKPDLRKHSGHNFIRSTKCPFCSNSNNPQKIILQAKYHTTLATLNNMNSFSYIKQRHIMA